MPSIYADYQLIARDMQASLRRVSERPEIAREIDYYLARIGDIDTIDEFMADERIYRFALKAAGLGDMIYARAFIRKVLEEGIDDPESFANRLADTRFRDFARRYDFKSFGATATTFERARQGAVDDYIRLTLEEDAGETSEGLRLALYFQRKAASLRTGYDILADPALMKVAETVLGFSLARGNIDKNARLIEERLKITELGDPARLERFLARFTTMWEMNAGAAGTGAAAANALIATPRDAGISMDILQTLQTLKITGK